MLVVAALASWRAQRGVDLAIVALARRPELGALARELGADEAPAFRDDGVGWPDGLADVVIETTGAPDGLDAALRLARREVHVKSTHGRTAGGLAGMTACVVDELRLEPWRDDPRGTGPVAWLARKPPPRGWCDVAVIRRAHVPEGFRSRLAGASPLGRADVAVVDDAASADAAIRPVTGEEVSLVRPRGRIAVHPDAASCDAPLLRAVAARGLVVSSSRCGDLGEALGVLAADPGAARLGDRLVTHRFGPGDLAAAFAAAGSPDCRKAVVEHPAA
jgi:hypothetical protein